MFGRAPSSVAAAVVSPPEGEARSARQTGASTRSGGNATSRRVRVIRRENRHFQIQKFLCAIKLLLPLLEITIDISEQPRKRFSAQFIALSLIIFFYHKSPKNWLTCITTISNITRQSAYVKCLVVFLCRPPVDQLEPLERLQPDLRPRSQEEGEGMRRRNHGKTNAGRQGYQNWWFFVCFDISNLYFTYFLGKKSRVAIFDCDFK